MNFSCVFWLVSFPSQSCFAQPLVYDFTFIPPPSPYPPTLVNLLSCFGVVVIIAIAPAVAHVIAHVITLVGSPALALETAWSTILTINHAVGPGIADIAMAIDVAVPPVIV